MENRIIIPVKKRMSKALFNAVMTAGIGALCYTFISFQIPPKGEFSWLFSGIAFICGIVFLWMLYELSFLLKKDVKVIIEVRKTGFIQVYCEDVNGKKFFEQEEINTRSVKQIYVLKERNTKRLNTDSFIEYVLKKDNEKVKLNILPGDLYSMTDAELNKILFFISQQNPEIIVGY